MNDRSDEPHDEPLSALYRETRDIEPPSWLDRRILMMAKAVAEPHPAPVAPLLGRRTTRWAVPLALAATVVLTVGVVRMVRESGEFETPSKSEAVRSVAKPTAEADAAATGRAAPLSAERELPRALPPAAPQIPVPVPSVAPLSFPASGVEPVATQPVPPAPPASSSAPVKSAAPKQRSMMPAERKKSDALEMAPSRMEESKPRMLQDQTLHRSPEEWLTWIAELRRRGQMVEADASLAEFRRQYPDYPPNAQIPPR